MKILNLDINVLSAIRNWWKFGLEPGSFTTCLILNDFEGAFERAHPNIKDEDIVADHIKWVQAWLPEQAKDMESWIGYNNLTKEDRNCIELSELQELEEWRKIN